jgi:hypothetical protein
VTLPASPIGVAIVSSPVNVTGNFSSARTVTNNNWNPGTSNNGFLALPVTLLSTEIVSLAANGVTQSSVGGSSGVFSNSNTLQAVWATCLFQEGNPGIVAPGAGANIAIWFAVTFDGATFEALAATSGSVARPPDAIFPLPAAATASPQLFNAAGGLVRLPPGKFKVYVANNTANTMGSGAVNGAYISCAPIAIEN